MRNLRRLMALLAVTALPQMPAAMPVLAVEPAENAADLEQIVRRLLGELAGETRAQRAGAEKRLVELGPRVLPLLPPPELLPSVSVREAVRRVRLELERTAAQESVRASRVTLEKTAPLGTTLAEIARQTANRLDVHLLPEDRLEQPIDLDLKSIPFWQALDGLCARLRLQYEYDAGIRGLKFMPARRGAPHETAVCYTGAFRVEALPAERIPCVAGRRRGQKARAADELLRVTVVLLPEPRLRPLFLQFAASEITARAGDQLKLMPFSPEADYELPLRESGAPAQFQLNYFIPKTAAANALELSGKLRCTTAAGHELIRFTDLEKAEAGGGANVARRRGGVTVTLNKVRVSPASEGRQEARIQVTVTYDAGGPAFESHRAWILHNEVFLEDRAGKRLELNGGSETTLQEDGAVGIEYRFVDLPAPLRNFAFVYVAPTLIVDVPIEFEIQSIPIGRKSPVPNSNEEIPNRSQP